MIQQKKFHRVLYAICILLITWGTSIAVQACLYNNIRGDEALSFMHSNPELFTLAQVWSQIKYGVDHSFIHAATLQLLFDGFGYHIYVQRGFSFLVWVVFAVLLFGLAYKYSCSRLVALLTLVLTLFSSMGFWLAADGRFYALTALAGLVHMYIFLYYTNTKTSVRHLLLLVIQLLSLLINPMLGVWHMLLVIAAFFIYSMRETARYMIGAFLAWLVYKLVFSGNAFDSYFLDAYAIRPFTFQWDATILEWPFRWLMVPSLPYMPDWIGALVLVILILAVVWPSAQKITPDDLFKKGFVKPFDVVVLVFVFFAIMLSIATIAGGIAVWPFRYFAFGYFVIPIWLSRFLILQTQYHRVAKVVLIALLCGWLLRMYAEQVKVNERRQIWNAWTHENVAAKTVFEEHCNNNYEPFVQAGQLYVRDEAARSKIEFHYCAEDTLRAQYFERLNKLRYPIQFVPISK
jgi:uncharacterized membrane protein YwzB